MIITIIMVYIKIFTIIMTLSQSFLFDPLPLLSVTSGLLFDDLNVSKDREPSIFIFNHLWESVFCQACFPFHLLLCCHIFRFHNIPLVDRALLSSSFVISSDAELNWQCLLCLWPPLAHHLVQQPLGECHQLFLCRFIRTTDLACIHDTSNSE